MNSQFVTNSLADLLNAAQAAEEDAFADLWRRYYPELTRFAEQRMVKLGLPRRVDDGEDVAASALGSFFRAVQNNRFHDMNDESSLLKFLFKITVWKIIDRKRKHQSLKAGGGKEIGESALDHPGKSLGNCLDQFTDAIPPPDVLMQLEEELQRLLAVLGDEQLQAMACMRLDGCDNTEIATRCRCSVATVERRFRLIRQLWTEAAEAEGS
jgi:RNA polymerase sigma factor (sigma-70 family)